VERENFVENNLKGERIEVLKLRKGAEKEHLFA